jgi:hypothetical protein
MVKMTEKKEGGQKLHFTATHELFIPNDETQIEQTRCLDQFVFPLPDRSVQNRRLHTTKDTAEPRAQLRPPL